MPGAPCEDPNTAIRTMDFPSKDRFLFVGGPLDGKRCHVEMTTHGPDNILYMREAPKMPAPSADMRPIPRWLSVRLSASTLPRIARASCSSVARAAPLGGASSPVTTTWPASSRR